jgi:hypothetical protein
MKTVHEAGRIEIWYRRVWGKSAGLDTPREPKPFVIYHVQNEPGVSEFLELAAFSLKMDAAKHAEALAKERNLRWGVVDGRYAFHDCTDGGWPAALMVLAQVEQDFYSKRPKSGKT